MPGERSNVNAGVGVADDYNDDGHNRRKSNNDKMDNESGKKMDNKNDNKTTRITSSLRPPRLLSALNYADVMGRHLIDWSDESIKFEWPGVRFTFVVSGTITVAIRLQTAGSVFGYQVTPCSDNSTPNTSNPNQEQALGRSSSNNNNNNDSSSSSPTCSTEEQLLGGGLFGHDMKDHPLATELDPNTTYQVQIWKRDDPGKICCVQGLVVDAAATGIKVPMTTTTTRRSKNNNKTAQNTLHLEFVGNSDTVGFGNLVPKSSMMYFLLCQMACIPLFPILYQGTDVTKSWPAYLCKALQENQSRTNATTRSHGRDNRVEDEMTISRRFDDVQYSVIAWSGIGAKYSVGIGETMMKVYPRLLPSDEMSTIKTQDEDNDDSKPQPPIHAVLVYLGQNDATSLQETFAYNEHKLTSAFELLLKMIRHRRPFPIPIIVIAPSLRAAVACAASERDREETCESQNRIWKALVQDKLGGTSQGYHFVENEHEPAIQLNSKNDFGMCLHWNAESQRKWANALEPKIRGILWKQQPVTKNNNQKRNNNKSRRITCV